MINSVVLILFVDLEWKIIYVGAAESEDFDQTLETILVGPVPGGRHKFVFQVSYEPPRGKTNNVVSDQVRHKPTCTSTE